MPDWKSPAHAAGGSAFAPPGESAAQERPFLYQEKLARWLVRELNSFDNLFFEIQNEPWSDNHTMGESSIPT